MPVTFKAVYWGDEDYMVGDNGTFWSHKRGERWKKRKPSRLSRKDDRLGLCFILNGKRQFILMCHLVLRTFIGPAPEGMEACHFPDRDLSNNRLDNLRWDTRKNNFKDRDLHGTTARGSRSGMSKLTEEQVLEIRKLHTPGFNKKYTLRYFAQKYKVDQSLIHMIIKRKIWRHI